MKNKQHLFGYYRKQKYIYPFFSNSPYFFDRSLNQKCKAVIVPLSVYQNNDEWMVSEDSQKVTGILKKALRERMVFITSSKDENSGFYALMYPLAKEESMTRTGYLLHKTSRGLHPVLVTIEGKEYLVEMKGCGSPVGGFPFLHTRKQAGCLGKVHTRITGGLSYEEALTEYRYIQLTKENDSPYELRTLGCTKFTYLNYGFGVLLRLTPSSVRASFSDVDGLDVIMPKKTQRSLYSMGKIAIKSMENKHRLFHYNLSENNMVRVSKTSYTLTDWSEASPLHDAAVIQDYVLTLFPVHFLSKSLNQQEMRSFLKGLRDGSVFFVSKIELLLRRKNGISLPNLVALNRDLLEYYGAYLFKYRIIHSYSIDYVVEHCTLLSDAMPESYFSQPLLTWVQDELIPEFEKKKKVLHILNKIKKQIGVKNLQLFIDGELSLKNKTLEKELHRVDPDYFTRQQKSQENISDLSKLDLQNPYIIHAFYELYIYNYSKFNYLEEIEKKCNDVIMQAKEFCEKGTLDFPSFEDISLLKVNPKTITFSLVLFPIFFQIAVYFENEKRVLDGAKKYAKGLSKFHQDMLTHNITVLKQKTDHFYKDPLYYKNSYCKSKKAFKKSLSLPYFK